MGQQTAFTAQEAGRFAALMAGFETANPSEAEALSKGRVLRRMAAEKKMRLVDALELPEIRQAIDAQLQPVRQAVSDAASMQKEIEDLRGKLAVTVPKVRKLAEELAARCRFELGLLGVAFVMFGVVGLGGLLLAVVTRNWGAAVLCGSSIVAAAAPGLLIGKSFERKHMEFVEQVREKAVVAYTLASWVVFGLGTLMYIACCIVAGGLVGPVAYIEFLYHCSHWRH